MSTNQYTTEYKKQDLNESKYEHLEWKNILKIKTQNKVDSNYIFLISFAL